MPPAASPRRGGPGSSNANAGAVVIVAPGGRGLNADGLDESAVPCPQPGRALGEDGPPARVAQTRRAAGGTGLILTAPTTVSLAVVAAVASRTRGVRTRDRE